MYRKLTSFKNLYFAYKECLKRKRNTKSAQEIEPIYEKILWKIKRQLETKTWQPKPYRAFVVKEPSLREIFAADFRDRIVHHALFRIINPVLEPTFIYHSYACRKRKGTHLAVKNLQKSLRKYSKYGQQVYFLKADVKSFFTSIDKEILIKIIEKTIKNGEIIWLILKIVLTNPAKEAIKVGNLSLFNKIPKHKSLFWANEGKGLPIGNLTSQLFANVYLNPLDQFVKHTLKAKNYFRYVDDFVILDTSVKKLERYIKRINGFLRKELLLELHREKTFIRKIEEGIDFLGYIVRPNYMLVKKRVIKNFKRKTFEAKRKLNKGEYFSRDLLSAVFNSYFAHFNHANSYRLKEKFNKLKLEMKNLIIFVPSLVIIALFFPILLMADNIDSTYKYSWGENIGWMNWKPSYGGTDYGVTVYNECLTGYIWAENAGWIKLGDTSCAGGDCCQTGTTKGYENDSNSTDNDGDGVADDWGVNNDGSGNLSGYAWGENVGWISFSSAYHQVVINESGEFTGYAWGENIGWINMNCSNSEPSYCETVDFKVKTTWTPAPSLTFNIDSNSKNLGNITPGTPITATTITTVTTSDTNGYSLKVHDGISGSNSALLHTDTTTRIADYEGTIASPTLWTGTGLGISVYTADTSKEAKWGTGTTETDSNNKYAGIPETATEIHNVASAVTDDDTYIGYKLDVPNTQKTGSYSGTITYTVVVNTP